MLSRHQKPGFTLIELLIVVAIIAILAAIAVPNFLDAQVRAKVSRVRTDLRSLGMALEAYHVDNDDYVPPNMNGYTACASQPFGGFFAMLSTPIPYIANSFLPDPFTKAVTSNALAGWGNLEVYYHYYGFNSSGSVQYWEYTGDGHYRGQPVYGNGANIPATDPAFSARSDFWILRSLGPDGVSSMVHFPEVDAADSYRAQHGCSWDDYWVMHKLPSETGLLPDRISSFVYDPSNGTRSNSDIFRIGGTADAGATNDQHMFFQYLLDATNGQ